MFLRISRTFARNIRRTKVKNDGPRKSAAPELEPDLYAMPKLANSIQDAHGGLGSGRPRAASLDMQQFLAGSPAARLPSSRITANLSLDTSALSSSLGLRGMPSSGSLSSAVGQEYYRNHIFAQRLSLQSQLPQLPANTTQRSLMDGLVRQQQQLPQLPQGHLQDQHVQGARFGATSRRALERPSLSLSSGSSAFPQNLSLHGTGNYNLAPSPLLPALPFDSDALLGSLTLPPTSQAPSIQHQQQAARLQAAQLQQGRQETDASSTSAETSRLILELFQAQQLRDAARHDSTNPGQGGNPPRL